MNEGSPAAGSMSRRVFALFRRLPVPIREIAYELIKAYAFRLVLLLVFPVLVSVFIVSTVIFGALTWVLGSPTGPISSIIATGWFASWTVLPVIITVRMWRSVPVLRRLVSLATDEAKAEPEPDAASDAVSAVSHVPDRSTYMERIAKADASLAPRSEDSKAVDRARTHDRPTG